MLNFHQIEFWAEHNIMNKIVKNLGFLKVKSWNNVRLFRKLAATSILSAIIVSLCGSNLAFAEVGGGREF